MSQEYNGLKTVSVEQDPFDFSVWYFNFANLSMLPQAQYGQWKVRWRGCEVLKCSTRSLSAANLVLHIRQLLCPSAVKWYFACCSKLFLLSNNLRQARQHNSCGRSAPHPQPLLPYRYCKHKARGKHYVVQENWLTAEPPWWVLSCWTQAYLLTYRFPHDVQAYGHPLGEIWLSKKCSWRRRDWKNLRGHSGQHKGYWDSRMWWSRWCARRLSRVG